MIAITIAPPTIPITSHDPRANFIGEKCNRSTPAIRRTSAHAYDVHPRMKLDVIQNTTAAPWYADGLQFTCQQCGNCCTGGPGYVWISDEEIVRLAEHLKLSRDEVLKKYCRKVAGRVSLKEVRTRSGNYDCIFLTEQKPEPGNGESVVHPKRGCSIYPVRPLQCRTWPFWGGNLASKGAWQRAGKGCYGIDRGRKFTLEEIVELRDAKDWPGNPPTSECGET